MIWDKIISSILVSLFVSGLAFAETKSDSAYSSQQRQNNLQGPSGEQPFPVPNDAPRPKTPEDTIIIAGTMIPDLFHPVKRGPYNAIYDQVIEGISEETGLKITLHTLPVKRARRTFTSQNSDCYFLSTKEYPGPLAEAPDATSLIHSITFHESHMKVFTPDGTPPPANTIGLKGLVVAADQGTGQGDNLLRALPEGVNVEYTTSLEQSIDMLSSDRVDAVVAYDLDMILFEMHNPSHKSLITDDDFILYTSEDSISCWNTAKNRKFLKAVNAHVKTLIEKDQLVDPAHYLSSAIKHR
ncbi:transporter substrate-binding domain-containing protein [Kordiimonas sp. SCSIO 12610]|uniref:transporter substrate-binding domain-containing protein n=1 Tax=Kordiimonas sp. SCSIO 12610 TaxID=2829597 RepID=UPI00210EE417|nr:transporter substrate-binding domain-containing protein [Kordiimonas sp. SCSIO 12610]UTW56133.1 transporter substrate-binding domain-containing protein [Kordiimonas sp. SCSIO 12610]